MEPEYKYTDITGRVIGCALKVHNILGCGFQEVIYQRALEIEMGKASLAFLREFEMPILYLGAEIGTRRVDFLVENKIMIELKAITALDDVHLAQTINYLEAFNLEIALLINFGNKSLQFKRLTNEKKLNSKTNV